MINGSGHFTKIKTNYTCPCHLYTKETEYIKIHTKFLWSCIISITTMRIYHFCQVVLLKWNRKKHLIIKRMTRSFTLWLNIIYCTLFELGFYFILSANYNDKIFLCCVERACHDECFESLWLIFARPHRGGQIVNGKLEYCKWFVRIASRRCFNFQIRMINSM